MRHRLKSLGLGQLQIARGGDADKHLRRNARKGWNWPAKSEWSWRYGYGAGGLVDIRWLTEIKIADLIWCKETDILLSMKLNDIISVSQDLTPSSLVPSTISPSIPTAGFLLAH